MARNSPKTVLAQLHRGSETKWKRHYGNIVNASRRANELCLLDGEPGDVIEFASTVSGMQIGTVKIGVGGALTQEWNGEYTQLQDMISAIKGGRDA